MAYSGDQDIRRLRHVILPSFLKVQSQWWWQEGYQLRCMLLGVPVNAAVGFLSWSALGDLRSMGIQGHKTILTLAQCSVVRLSYLGFAPQTPTNYVCLDLSHTTRLFSPVEIFFSCAGFVTVWSREIRFGKADNIFVHLLAPSWLHS